MRRLALVLIAGLVLGACSESTAPKGELFSIELAPGSVLMTATGQEQQLIAVARDHRGEVLAGIEYDWSSNNESVATVDGNGKVRAERASCTAIIRAKSFNGSQQAVESNGVTITTVIEPGPSASGEATDGASGCG